MSLSQLCFVTHRHPEGLLRGKFSSCWNVFGLYHEVLPKHPGYQAATKRTSAVASLLIQELQEIAARVMGALQLGSAIAATRELAALLGIGLHNRRSGNSSMAPLDL